MAECSPWSAAISSPRHPLPTAAPEAREALHQAVIQIGAVIPEIRSYIADLRPQPAGEHGLGPGLEALAEELRATGRLRVDLRLDADGAADLSPDALTELLLIVREATSNVVRHAGTTAVAIHLGHRAGQLRVLIRDNGQDFDVSRLNRRGQRAGDGLRNMAERARKLGGRLTLRSQPGGGTEAGIELSYRATARRA
jgi:two-component system sensor histidine kinase UhpB